MILEALIIRIGFWCILVYFNYDKEPPQIGIGNR